jgi:hypothetical protein
VDDRDNAASRLLESADTLIRAIQPLTVADRREHFMERSLGWPPIQEDRILVTKVVSRRWWKYGQVA